MNEVKEKLEEVQNEYSKIKDDIEGVKVNNKTAFKSHRFTSYDDSFQYYLAKADYHKLVFGKQSQAANKLYKIIRNYLILNKRIEYSADMTEVLHKTNWNLMVEMLSDVMSKKKIFTRSERTFLLYIFDVVEHFVDDKYR